ncbi:hypothetical protein [Streptomyces sp. NPDC101178]|uniref:hypothetical protein n=1 Tax=Streptomyces sp. NPDC101178 TaxID=3366124 RepID=UPI0038222D2C
MNDYERALSHWGEFDRTGDVAQLALAVDLLRTAYATASPADRHTRGGTLGLPLSRLYDQSYDLGVLRESIDVLRGGLREGSADDGYAYGLALALQKYAAEKDDLAALDESIGLMREASGSASVGQRLRARVLSALSTALQDRYEMASDPKALAESVTVGRASLTITPEGHPRRGPHLAHLGLALRMTYESTGDPAALAEAVEVSREAVHAVDDDVPSKDIEMGSLSLALRVMYEAHGRLAVLDEVSPPPAGVNVIDAAPIDVSLLGHGYCSAAFPVLTDIHALLYDQHDPTARIGLRNVGDSRWGFRELT